MASAGWMMIALAGCGGDVVVDHRLACEVPAPVGSLLSCHGAVAVDGERTRCSNLCLDADAHEYLSVCDSEGCECWFDGEPICDCRASEREQACRADATCCPSPWS